MATSTNTAPAVQVAETVPVASQISTKVILYWLEASRAHRILWLLEELKIPYEVKVFKRTKQHLAPPELKKIHPLGKSPVIGIQREGHKELIIAESALIIEYLIDHWGTQLKPERYLEGYNGQIGAERIEYMNDRWFMHMSEGSLMPMMIFKLLVNGMRGKSVPAPFRPITGFIAGKLENAQLHPRIHIQLEHIEQLAKEGGGPYLCGKQLTGSDFIMSYPLQGAYASNMITKQKYPSLTAWIDTIENMPSYKAAVKKTEEVDGKFELFPAL